MNVSAILNTKGGVGKSTLAFNVLPLIHDNIIIYEIDSSNNTYLEKSNIKAETFDVEKVDIVIDKIDFSFLTGNSDKDIIIDVGAGNDTKVFIENIKNEDFAKDIEYYIPVNEDFEQFKNLKDTIDMLKAIDKNIKVNLVLNRVNNIDDFDEVKKQFVNIFGSEDFGIESRFEEIQNNIAKIILIPNTPIFGIIKSQYQMFLPDIYPTVIELIENEKKYKQQWAKEGEDVFIQGKKRLKFFKQVKKLVETLKEQFSKKA